MPIDTGARVKGRAVSRIGPSPRSQGRTRQAQSLQRTARGATILGTATTAPKRAARYQQKQQHISQALARVRSAAASGNYPGLSPEQASTLNTVLNVGKQAGATKKELLAATETGLVESNFTNPDSAHSDATSAGWRQETAQDRYGSEQRRMQPKPTAKDFFSETASAGRGQGQTAGQLAQRVQGSAFPARYDEVRSQAKPLLHRFMQRSAPDPKDVRTLQKAGVKVPRPAAGNTVSPQVQHQERLVKAGKLDQGHGSLVVGSSTDIKYGQEPQIAARLKLLSAKIGKPIYIISGHRTPEHSVAVGGFADDPHTRGEAADIGVGSAIRSTAGSLTSAQLASVGLVRPFSGATEINHIQLANGSTGVVSDGGGSSGGGGSVGGSINPSSDSSAAPTGAALKKMSPRQRRLAIQKKLAQVRSLSGPVASADIPTAALARSVASRSKTHGATLPHHSLGL